MTDLTSNAPEIPGDDAPEAVARAFLSALDGRDWLTVARLIDADVAARFLEQQRRIAGMAEATHPSDAPLQTVFPAIAPSSDLAAVSPVEALARHAEVIDPATLQRRAIEASAHSPSQPAPKHEEPSRLVRTLVEVTLSGDASARATYQTDWYAGETRSPWLGGLHTLLLARGPQGWRVVEADLTGRGDGRLLLPDEARID